MALALTVFFLKAATDESIKWVPNRWVADGKIWTSSEGTAGVPTGFLSCMLTTSTAQWYEHRNGHGQCLP